MPARPEQYLQQNVCLLDNLKRPDKPAHKRVKKRKLATEALLKEGAPLSSSSSCAFVSSDSYLPPIPLTESLQISNSLKRKSSLEIHIDPPEKTLTLNNSKEPTAEVTSKPSSIKKKRKGPRSKSSSSSAMNSKNTKKNVTVEHDNELLSEENQYSFDEFESDISNNESQFYDSWVSCGGSNLSGFYSNFNRSEFNELCASFEAANSSFEKIEILRQLAHIFSVATEECLLGTMSTVLALCEKLLDTISFSGNSDEILLSVRIIANLLEVQPAISSSLVNNGLLGALCLQLQQLQDIDIADQVLVILELLSSRHSFAVLESGALLAALNFIDFFTSSSQRAVVQALYNCTNQVDSSSVSNMAEIIQLLSNTINMPDSKLASISWNCIENIIKKSSSANEIDKFIDKKFLETILIDFIDSEDSARRKKLLSVLGLIAQKSLAHTINILESDIVQVIYSNYPKTFDTKNTNLLPKNHQLKLPENQKDFTYLEAEIIAFLVGLLPSLYSVVYIRENNGIDDEASQESIKHQAEKCRKLDTFFNSNRPTAFQIANMMLSISISCIKTESNHIPRKKLLESILLGLWMFDLKKYGILDSPDLETFSPWFISHGFDEGLPTLVASLMFAHRFLYFADNKVKLSYERQGSVTLLQKMANKGSKPSYPDLFSKGVVYLDDLLPSGDTLNSSYINLKNGSNKKIEEWKKVVSTLILDSHWVFDKVDSNLISERGDTMFKLNQASKATKNIWKRANLLSQNELSAHVNTLVEKLSSPQGLTAYEFENSGWLETLSIIGLNFRNTSPRQYKLEKNPASFLAFLAFDTILQNIQLGKNSSALKNFIKILHELLASNDTLQVNILPRGLNGPEDNQLLVLAKQVSVDLQYYDTPNNPDETKPLSKSRLDLLSKLKTDLKPMKLSTRVTSPLSVLSKFLKPHISRVIQKNQNSPSDEPVDETINSSSFRPFSISDGLQLQEALSHVTTSANVQIINSTKLEQINNEVDSLNESDTDKPHVADPERHVRGSDDEKLSIIEDEPIKSSGLESSTKSGSKFNPQKFSIEFYYVNKLNNSAVKLDPNDNIYASFMLTQHPKPKKKASTFNPWSNVFSIKYKIIFENSPHDENKPATPTSYAHVAKTETEGKEQVSLRKELPSYSEFSKTVSKKFSYALNILNALHTIQEFQHVDGRPRTGGESWKLPYQNNRLTQKVRSLLDDPLTIATKAFPKWCFPLVTFCSYLFPFEIRNSFIRCIYLPLARNLSNWKANHFQTPGEQHDDPNGGFHSALFGLSAIGQSFSNEIVTQLGSIRKQKVLINRLQLFDSAVVAINKFGNLGNILEVEYVDEVGTGLGPTLEFYSSVCTEIFNTSNNMWHNGWDGDSTKSDYIVSPNGFYPRPVKGSSDPELKKYVKLFTFLGMFVAKAIADERPIDLPLHPAFIAALLSSLSAERNFELDHIRMFSEIDPKLAKTCSTLQSFLGNETKQLLSPLNTSMAESSGSELLSKERQSIESSIEDLCIDFTLPGYPSFLLCDKGDEILVNKDNLQQYLDLVRDAFMNTGIETAVQSFKEGFSNVFPVEFLSTNSISELSMIFGLTDSNSEHWHKIEDCSWSYEMLLSNIVVDHGYTPDSPVIHMFISWLSNLSRSDRRLFLKFVTGSPRLPPNSLLLNGNSNCSISGAADGIAPITTTTSTIAASTATAISGSTNKAIGTSNVLGFGALKPKLTVVLRHSYPPLAPDSYLPTVMTCVNYIKLPNYSSIEVLDKRWRQAFDEGSSSFHLS